MFLDALSNHGLRIVKDSVLAGEKVGGDRPQLCGPRGKLRLQLFVLEPTAYRLRSFGCTTPDKYVVEESPLEWSVVGVEDRRLRKLAVAELRKRDFGPIE